MQVKFSIIGNPKGKDRPRASKYGHVYTPAPTKDYEKLVENTYNKLENPYKFEGEIKVVINAYYGIVKSVKEVEREQMLKNEIRPQKTPDADNVAKIVLDGLNKVAYDDDKQIVELQINKWYAEEGRVDVIITDVLDGIKNT